MEVKEKNLIINKLLECVGEAIDFKCDDSGEDDILIGLIDLCKKATYIPTKKVKRKWIKSRREGREVRGCLSFLKRELTDEASYRNYLRLSKQQFQCLLSLVERDISRSNTHMRIAISAAEKLSICLRFLTTGETFRSMDYQSRVSKASISRIIPEVCEAIFRRLKETYLKFPSNQSEWKAIANTFNIKWQFPNCLGALDGKHINFRPLRRAEAYYNYKGNNSIVLMALVDANCKFIFVDIDCDGRNNDARVFLQSNLSRILQAEIEIPKSAVVGNGRRLPYVVVGDDAFPMQTHLIKPYPYNTTSSKKQIFNARLSRARQVVERAFDMLTNRFRVLLSTINLKVETVEKITFACCSLHNFLLENDSTYAPSNGNIALENNLDNTNMEYNPLKYEDENTRQEFTTYFNNEGKVDWI